MELGNRIKTYRQEKGWSQETLAEKTFVSRQTISNWENDKSYPDIQSLLLLSTLFDVSLDQLVKGDIEIMKKELNQQDIDRLKKDSRIFTGLMALMMITPYPLARFLGWYGMAIFLVIIVIGMYFALRIEKEKKANDIQTYREIEAFFEGQTLDEITKAREEGKRPYQKIISALLCGMATILFFLICWKLFG